MLISFRGGPVHSIAAEPTPFHRERPSEGHRLQHAGHHIGERPQRRFIIVPRDAIRLECPTSTASMNNRHIPVASLPEGDRFHDAAAETSPVAYGDVDMKAVQTAGAMVAFPGAVGGVGNHRAAVFASEPAGSGVRPPPVGFPVLLEIPFHGVNPSDFASADFGQISPGSCTECAAPAASADRFGRLRTRAPS